MADNLPDIQTSRNNEIIRQWLTESEILNSTRASEKIIQILDEDPNLKVKFYESLKNDLIKTVISNPVLVQQVLDALNQKFEERMASDKISPQDRINAIKNHTKLISWIGSKLAEATLNIDWDNELKQAERNFKAKEASLITTYWNILNKLKSSN